MGIARGARLRARWLGSARLRARWLGSARPRARRWAGAPAALAAALWAAPAAAEFSVLDLRNSLVQFALAQISIEGAFEITAERVTEPQDGVTELEGVAIADGAGVWFRAEAFSVRWNASALLGGVLDLEALTLRGARVSRQPTPPSVSVREDALIAAGPPRGLFDWPRAPISVRVGALRVADAALAPGVIAEQGVAFDAVGAALDQGDQQALTLSVTRRDAVEGAIEIDLARDFAAETVAASLTADEAAGGLAAAYLGLPADSASRVRIVAEGPVADWRLALSAAADAVLEVELDAVVDTRAPLRVEAAGAVRPGPLLAPDIAAALGDEARFDLLAAETGAAEIVIERGALVSPALQAAVTGRFRRADQAYSGSATLEAGPALARAIGGFDAAALRFDGDVAGVGGAVEATGALALEGFASAAADVGAAALDVRFAREESGDWRAAATGDADGVRIDRLAPDRIGPARLSLSAAQVGGRTALEALSVESALLTAEARGVYDAATETAELTYAIDAPDLAPVAAAYGLEASGAIRAEGALGGPLDALVAEGRAEGAALSALGRPLGPTALSHRLQVTPSLEGRVAVAAEPPGFGPLAAETRLRSGPGVFALSDISLSGLGISGWGVLAFQSGRGLAEGALALNAPTLAPLGRFLDVPLAGAAEARLALAADDGVQTVDAEARARGLTAGGARVAEGRVALAGPLSRLAFGLEGRGTDASGAALSLAAAGAADLAAAEPRLTLQTVEAARGALTARLTAPATVVAAPDGVRFEDVRAALPGAALAASGLVGGGGVAVTADAAVDDLGALASALIGGAPAPVTAGRLEATLTLDTRAASAGGALTVAARDIVLETAPPGEAPLSGVAEAEWDGRAATARAEIAGPFGEPLTAEARLPLRPAGATPAPPQGAALDAAVRWRGRVERIWELLPLPDHLLSGDLDLDLRLTGAPTAPAIGGRVTLENGAYEFLETGTILTSLSAQSVAEPSGAFRLEAAAEDGSGAPVTATLRYAEGEIAGRVTSREAVLVRRDDATAALSLDIAAEGPAAAPLISGAVRIDRAEIRLVDALPPGIADLGPVEIAGAVGGAAQRADADPAAAGGPTLDLAITAPGGVFVRGRGLDSEWRADLTVVGPASGPEVTGAIDSVRGRLDLLGQPFDLSRGRVAFFGAVPPDPSLDIALERQRADLLGRIAVRGAASDPIIAFESEPALPEGEVLPRVLFGRSQQSLSPDQALQLASGVATLLSGGDGVIGQVRSAVGLDVLGVDRGEDGVAVRAGRTVADGVFVGVKQPIDGAGPTLEVEAEIFEGVTVDSEVRQQGGSSIGLNYRFDF